MEPFRLKMKIGPHEFEAEGDQASVEAQFAVWRELIASPSASVQPPASAPPLTPPAPAGTERTPVVPPVGDDLTRAEYDRLFRHESRVVSLTVPPQTQADGALLVLLGQKAYNGEDMVTGAQIMEGLQRSGMTIDRADRVFGDHMPTNVIRIGQNRATRYRLTNPGVARARELARGLLTMVP